ncbi:hypothetical protein GCM10028803_33840 [Larkinella knui]|uniref:VanZ-like domain-containing protein n=2 Tax=Larkinella knui TaxID=2025310 RepID=A0A3P1CD64_9BACT|nr:hypothetical protein EHT87_22490 [Larkinella knui]
MIALTIGIVFGLSWLPNPHLSKYGFLPARLAYWTDADANMNVRTAVPMVFLGLFSGIWLISRKYGGYWWAGIWLALVLIILIAEVGQLALPRRHFDWGDVMWGALGALGGITAIRMAGFLVKK